MKFTIDKNNIINEFQSLAAVADKKQTLPILSNILIRCEESKVTLLSTDLEVELEIVAENAKEFSKSFEEELKLVIIHGILHAIGYEDTTDEKKAVMEKEQSKLFELLLQQ